MALRLRWFRSMAEIPPEAWDTLALALEAPILEWEWLRQLEVSGSICPRTGWLPLHLTAWRGSDLVAAAPLYAKGHSEGEFVWDHVWADVAGQLGLAYYPKLVGMSPATPVPGYRFLVAPGEDEDEVADLLLGAVERVVREDGLSGVHFPYAAADWQRRLAARGYLAWRHQSFCWEREGLATFDDYLAAFDHNQRKNVRRERRALEEAGIRVRFLAGDDIRRSDLALLYRLYEGTNAKFGPWAAKYLTEPFFTGLWEGYRHRLLLVAAYREDCDAPLGLSLLLVKGRRLYGRYWGSFEPVPGLHFELCYYAPIRWALAHGVEHFDPGIGGHHKVRRGFRAVANHSLHRFADPRLQAVMAAHIDRINAAEQHAIDEMNAGLPLAEGRGGA